MNLRHVFRIAAGLFLVAAACSTPTAGPTKHDAGAGADAADATAVAALWRATTVGAGVGEAHNLLPEETALVRAAVDMKSPELRKCFEDPVLHRGCRTGGVPASFDAMLMIDTDGNVRDTRIVPNKNDLARECFDAVSCAQDVFGTMQVQGLTRYQGTRQVYMTISLRTPDESAVGHADGG